jgi:hypothetical protein
LRRCDRKDHAPVNASAEPNCRTRLIKLLAGYASRERSPIFADGIEYAKILAILTRCLIEHIDRPELI